MRSPLIFRIYKKEQIFVVKQFIDDDRIIIGSSPEAHINLGSEVSPIHCLVEKRGHHVFLCDMGSESGTVKDGKHILDEMISSGESFEVGPYKIVLFVGAQKPVLSAAKTEVKTPLATTSLENKKIEQKSSQSQLSLVAAQAEEVRKAKTDIIVEVTLPPEPQHELDTEFAVDLENTTKADVSEIIYEEEQEETGELVSTDQYFDENHINDVRDFLKVGHGEFVEVLVCWQDKVLNTYHFNKKGKITLGPSGDVKVPEGAAPKDWTLLNFNSEVTLSTCSEMQVERLKDGELTQITESSYKLQQSEAYFILLINGLQLVVRFAPKPPSIVFDSPFILGSSELAGMLAALIIAILTSLLVSVYKPKPIKNEVEVERLAEIVFTPRVEPEKPVPVEEKKAEEPKKIEIPDQAQAKKIEVAQEKPKPKAGSSEPEGAASEVKPKDTKLKVKMFTSTTQGGAVKTSNTAGANAKSKEVDLKNTGLLAAFGSGGAREKLDKAYSGAGQLIGDSEKATGSSGFNTDRKGDDLGFKTKDTGAGGFGTATQGIAGVNTKGRGGGLGGYGSGQGLGEKGEIQISAGGGGETFVGTIDKEAVRRVVRYALPQFKSCYEREYRKNTNLSGKVVVRWDIDDKGTAKNARIVKEDSTLNNKAVEDCVRLRMLGLKFPETPAGTYAEVSYPFLFEGPKF